MSRDIGEDIENLQTDLSSENSTVLVFGLGYVGLPLAVEFSQGGFDTYGYDIDRQKIRRLKNGEDPTGEVGDEALRECDITYCESVAPVGESDYIIIAVPTPVTDGNEPNTEYIESAGAAIGERISPGTTVVLESTVYPGATRDVLIPALEDNSQLSAGDDFQVGYSPERIVPGADGQSLRDTVKIVSGQNEAARDEIADLYRRIVDVGVCPAPSLESAEAAKCLENAQRDLNIAFVNEFAMACNSTDIDVDATEVLELAGTKWNFHDYSPGLVGGHCVPVDPYYLIHTFEEGGFTPELMKTARETNDSVAVHVAEMTAAAVRRRERPLGVVGSSGSRTDVRSDDSGGDANVLLLGLAYKPNTSDARNPVLHSLIDRARDLGLELAGFDPHVDTAELDEQFDIPIQEELSVSGYDALLITTPHDEFTDLDLDAVREDMNDDPVIVDVMSSLDPDEVRDIGFEYERL